MDADLLVSGHIACETGFDVPNDRQIIIDCAECPAGYLLFPTDRPLTHAELVGACGRFIDRIGVVCTSRRLFFRLQTPTPDS